MSGDRMHPEVAAGGHLTEAGGIPTGKIRSRRLGDRSRTRYYLWHHPIRSLRSRWLIVIHGISRDPRKQVRLLRPLAERHGYSLVAPLFEPDVHPHYQQLGLGSNGCRADLTLCRLHDELVRDFDTPERFDLFGFSGGAQFCHRFAMFHPGRVRRLVLASAGWYTLPTVHSPFPYGIDGLPSAGMPGPDLSALASIPQLVLVGEADNERDTALRKRPNLDRGQGRDRVARARSWTAAMHALALAERKAPCVELRVLPGVGHDFVGAVRIARLDQQLFGFIDQTENPK